MNFFDRHQKIVGWFKSIQLMIEQLSHQKRKIKYKSSCKDLVSDTDIKIERYLIEQIKKDFPHEHILAEESASQSENLQMEKTRQWIIDPIDGTVNYICKQADFASMLALYEDGIGQMAYIMDWNKQELYYAFKGQGVYVNGQKLAESCYNQDLSSGLLALNSKIVQQDSYQAIRQLSKQALGVRMTGSAGLELINLVRKHTVAYLSSSLMPWDIAAGQLILNELNLSYSNFSGDRFDLTQANSVIMAQPQAFNQIHSFLRDN